MWRIQLKLPDPINPGGLSWISMCTKEGKVYEFETEEEAERIKRMCYPEVMNDRVRVVEYVTPEEGWTRGLLIALASAQIDDLLVHIGNRPAESARLEELQRRGFFDGERVTPEGLRQAQVWDETNLNRWKVQGAEETRALGRE